MKRLNFPPVAIALIAFLPAILAPVAGSGNPAENPALKNLYRVFIRSPFDAYDLSGSGADALLQTRDGYIVLVNQAEETRLLNSSLESELIAQDVARGRLALDRRPDGENAGIYPVLFEEGHLRLLIADDADLDRQIGLIRLPERGIDISFRTGGFTVELSPKNLADVDTIISKVNQDTLTSCLETLQSLPNRRSGHCGDSVCLEWAVNKFTEYGYDSMVFDTFSYFPQYPNLYPEQNLAVFKLGTEHPNHQIIVCAHRDAYYFPYESPGADENGSGTVGVLEIARVLKDIDTRATIVFLLFDRGAYPFIDGLGSWYYAEAARERGDSIVAVLNMDMIGYYENTDQAMLFYGYDSTYAQLWIDLAASIPQIGLTGHFGGTSTYSDHYPFQVFGYDVVAQLEYIVSPVAGTDQDITSYISFPYLTRMVKACLATAWEIDRIAPLPTLKFSYPDGLPSTLNPHAHDTIMIQIDGHYGGEYLPGSGLMGYSVEWEAWDEAVFNDLGGGLYSAVLPLEFCNEPFVRYAFVAVEAATNHLIYEPPPPEPYSAITGTTTKIVFEDDFETDKGWTSEGSWERGTPIGGTCYYSTCPTYAYSGDNIYGYNLDGCYEFGLWETNLISPLIDCSELSHVQLRFQRWLGVHEGFDDSYDYASIWASYNGVDWEIVYFFPTTHDTSWNETVIDMSHVADNQPELRVRFTMGPTDFVWNACGWNIDDLIVEGYDCDRWDLEILTDTVPSWTAALPYSGQLYAYGGTGSFGWHDKYNELEGTGLSLSPNGLLSGADPLPGAVGFTAVVSDETKASDEKYFDFVINDTLKIMNDSLKTGYQNEYYNQMLTVSGGTGSKKFTDKYGVLAGSGLGLSSGYPNGYLIGTPVIAGHLDITIVVTDMVGATFEREYGLDIIPDSFICGDANADLSINILDVSYLINYLYKNGPAPLPLESGDADGSGIINLLDATYLINYLYKNGPDPIC